MKNKRLFVYGLLVVMSVLAILKQQSVISEDRSKEKRSNFLEWQRHGKPVVTATQKKQTVRMYTKITAIQSSEQELISYVPRSIQEKIRPGQDFYIEGDQEKKTGKVLNVSELLNMDTGLFEVRLMLDQEVQVAEKRFVLYVNTDKFDNAICISNDVIDTQAGENIVWVAENGKAVKKVVTIQQRNGYGAIIASGLVEGDVLIVEGFNMLDEGDKLNFMNPKQVEEN